MKLIDKFIFCSISLFLFTNILLAQTPPAVQQDLMNFEPGELIVKLKDNVDAGITYAENGKAVSSFNIGELLSIEDKVASSKVMFHQKGIEASIANSEKMKAVYMAKGMTNPKDPLTMKNIFVLKTLNVQENILMLIEEIKNNPNVEYAEPNYIYSIDDFEVGETIYDETTDNDNEQESSETSDATIDVDDPLYSSQTNITSTNIDDVWEQYTTGDGSQVIAILDTGGDYTHPDLEANTWINTEELNGVEGYDDDGNGYIDDIRGWDFINLDNAPLDDNMHGTHVAGIAGAVGNNGIGIAGAAWNVKLLHIKVFQSTGQGNSTTIAAGVEYASENGADILNMSFGSYSESFTLKSALENAYATATLVAASGNNGFPLGPCAICAVFYPAAYSYVLGVEDSEGGYNNFDNNNPIFTQYAELFNYELKAPGTAIMSTIPNGGYSTLTGTSMATPLVAGAIALYNQIKPEDSGELMMGSLINTSVDNRVNILAAIESEPTPLMALMLTTTRDTINNQNGNGFIEPEETIEILPTIKNYWGPTEDVRVGIEFAEFEDQSKATIVQDEIQIGSISAYASLQDLEETLKITISEGVANNVDIKFILTAWSGPDQEYMSDPVEFVINIKNSILLYGIIDEDMTLTSDKEYLVPSALVLDNAHLNIEPGTTLSISDNVGIKLVNGSKITALGLNNNKIYFVAENNYWTGFDFSGSDIEWQFDFCEFNNFRRYWHEPNSIESNFTTNSLFFDNTFVTDGYTSVRFIQPRSNFSYNNIFDNNMREGAILDYSNSTFFQDGLMKFRTTHNNVIGNRAPAAPNPVGGRYSSGFYLYGGIHEYDLDPNFHLGNSINNTIDKWTENVIGEAGAYVSYIANLHGSNSGSGVSNTPKIYIGTSIEETMRGRVRDFLRPIETNGNVPINVINLSNVDFTPDPLAHGIVWKVLVNGFDAQDEYALLDPLGVGEHEFKVYFNRAMDTSVNPKVSYGVTIPYNQKIISEEGTWSDDGKIYTVTHDIRIGAADGINRIRVQDAQDLDYFKIPVEDTRFNFLLQSAGSASTGFLAQGGLGKIDLEWVAPSADELDDALGYNMYRYQVDADGLESEPVKLNETLIIEDTDPSTTGVYFSDYAVLEGETYFYKYKILRTSFEETDFSQTVSSAPLTSTLGDSNGDFAVDVLDLVHDVDYILGNNPTPFIFVAGDVNADETINVLDIVGTVDIILNPSSTSDSTVGSNEIQFYPSQAIGTANFTWEGNDLYVASDHNIGGIQLAFDVDFEYVLTEDLPTIEHLDYTQEDSKILMLYSFNNTMIASSKTKILTRLDASQEFDIEQAVVGTTSGAKLTAVLNNGVLSTIDAPFQNKNLQFLNLFPNPTEGVVNLEYYLPEQMDGVVAKVYDMLGRLVHIQVLENREGISKTPMELSRLKTGNYIVLITANKGGSIKNIANKKLIVK